MKKRIIVTGGTGFIGANLVRRLLKDKHDVNLLVRSSHSSWRLQDILKYVKVHEVKLFDKQALEKIIGKISPNWIFHLAAYGAYSWQEDIGQMEKTNVIATRNLVEVCAKIGFESFVNTGSSSEYGFKDHPPQEAERLQPNSDYGATKAQATLFCHNFAQEHKLNITTLRLYSVYGPYEDYRRLIPRLIIEGFYKRFPPLAQPDISRDFVYIEDVLDAYLLAIAGYSSQDWGVIYNVGTGIQMSLRQVVEIARKVLGINTEPQWGTMPNRSWDTNIWVADNRKIKRELGWQPSFSFEEGFKNSIEWFVKNDVLLGCSLKGSIQ